MSSRRKARVLLVEDDELIREVYSIKLEMAGFEVATAENGLKAIEQVQEQTPDVVLLDMMMPVMGGLDFLRAVKLPQSYPELDVIIFSNISSPQQANEALALGARQYLKKSDYTPDQLAQYLAKRNHHKVE